MFSLNAQKKSKDTLIVEERISFKRPNPNPLAPSKAAFYSAILPGLGQAYNKRYWKIPIVYAAIGTGVYFYIDNTNEYNRYRDAFKRRLAGFTDDEFYDLNGDNVAGAAPDVSEQALRDAQEVFQRNRELSLLITVGLYLLNIIDANVDAHLQQFNVSEDLSFKPVIYQNDVNFKSSLGFRFSYRF
ncbi:DUF5683 domain-containing protein [Ascidiimonas sp. W6]|uniref:DUF5683 domain-containing protein n=1 Tax=Ascidiimonas meishanensis TaxID=3128903 RepID=UPI0030ED8D4D